MEQDAENPEILAALAECLRKRGDLDGAAGLLRQAIAIAPESYKAHRVLAEIELSQGRPGEALGHLERAATQRPYDIAVRFMLGQTLRALGRADEAKGHLDYVARADEPLQRVERQCRQAALRPGDFELRYEIGMGLLAYGNPEDGARWLRSVLQLNPNHAAARRALAGYLEGRGDRKPALAQQPQLDAQGPLPPKNPFP
jgi:tetratricopeptide (TPR) repeat protein